ncbi:MAG: transcriptional regulator [bacterium (Candidatus Ratteibacteria) CG_4_10_14_3_um_filter_41_18]|uniref:Transcriptional regulator n=3 Tax=Candidatus Ratteibacteria TaxID=2979319 RepID=A0A2M7E6Q0_9BACT|nr:MAG: transcriptional regulator [bacterium (Candidatus Ratteibacteria) CG01_land_8_20_14_3_00_40_19]PIW33297.1 MAG: transcriptional regulator [bacterium (Candidatus Ratteibacteria) CG15_BIG_FIL_POST_REV_8_21_14_020_41_12]PIX77009.1 MAG: transcriptional regulator [bacterium (Candidatus Ratteibacteria) CG_4_10_14_3_um_filter_41_18]
MKVPILDLNAQHKKIEEEINQAIKRVCASGQFILGDEVAKFEEEIASYCKVDYAIGVSSGTDSLLVSLMALGIAPGDEVITSAYSFFATAGVISRLSAKPVFVDIEPETFNINPFLIEEKITGKTKALLPVHLFGQVAEMSPVMQLAEKYNLAVIEDSAQAIGAQYKDERIAGTIGDAGCLSFFPTKNLGGFGDGGMVLTRDKKFSEKIRILRVHGARPKYYHKVIGGNFRLDSLQAAILRVKLKYLDEWTEKRQENGRNYRQIFIEKGLEELVHLPKAIYHPHLTPPPLRGRIEERGIRNYHIYNQFVIRVKKRDQLKEFLEENGVDTAIYYPISLPLQECFKGLGYRSGDFPQAERAAKETLALPIYPEITREMQEYVVEKIKEFYG